MKILLFLVAVSAKVLAQEKLTVGYQPQWLPGVSDLSLYQENERPAPWTLNFPEHKSEQKNSTAVQANEQSQENQASSNEVLPKPAGRQGSASSDGVALNGSPIYQYQRDCNRIQSDGQILDANFEFYILKHIPCGERNYYMVKLMTPGYQKPVEIVLLNEQELIFRE